MATLKITTIERQSDSNTGSGGTIILNKSADNTAAWELIASGSGNKPDLQIKPTGGNSLLTVSSTNSNVVISKASITGSLNAQGTSNFTGLATFNGGINVAAGTVTLPTNQQLPTGTTLAGALDTNDNSSKVATTKFVKEQFCSLPAGMVAPFAMATPPGGWLYCDGQWVLKSEFPDLFAVIGTYYNVGYIPPTHFRIPDLRGTFIRSWNNSGGGWDPNRIFGSGQGDAIRNFNGHIDVHIGYSAGLFEITNPNNGVFKVTNNAGYSTDGKGGGAGGRRVDIDASLQVPTANENRPVNVALMYCIKT